MQVIINLLDNAVKYSEDDTPVTISMPVNLRNYYPSMTSRNFFNSVLVSHVFKGGEDVESLSAEYQNKLKAELTPEAVEKRMLNYEKMESLFFIRMVPLLIKNPVINMVNKRVDKEVTLVLSNLGKMSVPAEVKSLVFCVFNLLPAGHCAGMLRARSANAKHSL